MSGAGNRRPPNAGKGRQKGVPNKTTLAAKEAMELAFQGLGGVDALKKWAEDNPTEFYRIWSRLIPTASSVTTKAEDMTPEERDRRAQEVLERAGKLRLA